MTLAALSPLYTWWPLFFGLLVFILKVVCPRVRIRQWLREMPGHWPPYADLDVTTFGDPDSVFVTVGFPPPNPSTRVV